VCEREEIEERGREGGREGEGGRENACEFACARALCVGEGLSVGVRVCVCLCVGVGVCVCERVCECMRAHVLFVLCSNLCARVRAVSRVHLGKIHGHTSLFFSRHTQFQLQTSVHACESVSTCLPVRTHARA
jgi:hypothetical protein